MALTYELWNTKSGNRVGEFESREAAIDSVRRTMRRHGVVAVETWALGYEDEEGEGEVIARGADLAALAGGDPGPSSPPTSASSHAPTPTSVTAARPRRPVESGSADTRPLEGHDFSVNLASHIAASYPRVSDILGHTVADALLSKFAIPPDALMPSLVIPREVVDPLRVNRAIQALANVGLQSFGTVEWGNIFTAHNERFAASIADMVHQTHAAMSADMLAQWSRAADDVAQALAALSRPIDGAIIALAHAPEKRFAYRATDEGDYLGGIAVESDDEPYTIRVVGWWEIDERLAS